MKNEQVDENGLQAVSPIGSGEIARKSEPVPEIVVIYDECGDSLWDAVLEQEYPALRYPDIIF